MFSSVPWLRFRPSLSLSYHIGAHPASSPPQGLPRPSHSGEFSRRSLDTGLGSGAARTPRWVEFSGPSSFPSIPISSIFHSLKIWCYMCFTVRDEPKEKEDRPTAMKDGDFVISAEEDTAMEAARLELLGSDGGRTGSVHDEHLRMFEGMFQSMHVYLFMEFDKTLDGLMEKEQNDGIMKGQNEEVAGTVELGKQVAWVRRNGRKKERRKEGRGEDKTEEKERKKDREKDEREKREHSRVDTETHEISIAH